MAAWQILHSRNALKTGKSIIIYANYTSCISFCIPFSGYFIGFQLSFLAVLLFITASPITMAAMVET
jgi:hypothetical protein